MEVTVMAKTKVEVRKLHCVMGVRYWEDGEVNGKEDDDNSPVMPFALGNTWKITIDLETGRIDDWPEGVAAKTHYKVCDDGFYSLIGKDGSVVASLDGYVPSMLAPNGGGFGDYVILNIRPDGSIENFRADLSVFDAV
ncbi:hypothetical protein KU6B_48230 [Mameliella alba]|uniref:hypothetical protein n=1 Tax=Mameliella alba TaxID=561184 RepID=UPI0013E41C4C|nr:hypothetical protein [Mameliella alba]BBU58558.1 hypothetical protein KU6B_48230 [Mameliella alba]